MNVCVFKKIISALSLSLSLWYYIKIFIFVIYEHVIYK